MHHLPASKPMSMYPVQRAVGPMGLTRYGSAPGSLLTSIVDSVVGGGGELSAMGGGGSSENAAAMGKYFSGGDSSPCLTSESSCKAAISPDLSPAAAYKGKGGGGGLEMGLQRSYGMNDVSLGDLAMACGGGGSDLKAAPPSVLLRHSSSPAGFFSNLMGDNNGFSITRAGNYPGVNSTRLKSQLSFSSSRQDSLSQISEISIPDVGESSDEAAGHVGQSYISSSNHLPTAIIGSWDDTNSIVFAPSSKRARLDHNNGDIITAFGSSLDSHQYLSKASLEMEKLLQIPQDTIPCKIRAKRGCATHPRSIAERERRTRISEKLRKLQELVPNMDKQTNTADMLDLAVQHIKGLQSQVQKLNQERANCTCVSKQEP